jgi:hypothetical protein
MLNAQTKPSVDYHNHPEQARREQTPRLVVANGKSNVVTRAVTRPTLSHEEAVLQAILRTG